MNKILIAVMFIITIVYILYINYQLTIELVIR
jgi:hypothetical protein